MITMKGGPGTAQPAAGRGHNLGAGRRALLLVEVTKPDRLTHLIARARASVHRQQQSRCCLPLPAAVPAKTIP